MVKDSYCASMDNRKLLCSEFSNWFRSGSCVMVDEEKTPEEEPTTEDTGTGDKPEETTLIDDANLAAKRMEDANKEKRELLNREEALMVQSRLSGRAEAGTEPEKPKKLTDTEYAEALERGEVNPLKEDGLI